jgi:archaellum component FlaC
MKSIEERVQALEDKLASMDEYIDDAHNEIGCLDERIEELDTLEEKLCLFFTELALSINTLVYGDVVEIKRVNQTSKKDLDSKGNV